MAYSSHLYTSTLLNLSFGTLSNLTSKHSSTPTAYTPPPYNLNLDTNLITLVLVTLTASKIALPSAPRTGVARLLATQTHTHISTHSLCMRQYVYTTMVTFKFNRRMSRNDSDCTFDASRASTRPAGTIYSMYDDENNPFQDAQLSKPFQWKYKRDGRVEETEDETRARKQQTWKELVELKKKRELRELQAAQHEEDQERLAKERQHKYAVVYEREENRFLLAQTKLKSLNHLKDASEKLQVIDIMYVVYAMYVRQWMEERKLELPVATSSLEYQVSQLEGGFYLPKNLPFPIDYVGQIESVSVLEALISDVSLFQKIETERLSYCIPKLQKHDLLPSAYWSAILVVLENRATQLDSTGSVERMIFLPEISLLVDELLNAKTTDELKRLGSDIELILGSDALIDIEFWQAVSKRASYYKALTYVRQIHKKVLDACNDKVLQKNSSPIIVPEKPNVQLEAMSTRFLRHSDDTFANNEYSTTDMSYDDGYLNDHKRGEYLDEDALYQIEKSKGVDVNEEILGGEVVDLDTDLHQLISSTGLQDKFLPRKPKYFNRVKAGYEWTKYNQVHYDVDNPPPKVIQGYKFIIFYPDLIDPKKVPGYSILPSDSPDFVILKFVAGPPYLDIAFRIVNKEWSLSQKHGFKSLFSRGVLYLWFNFKRLCYKR